MVCRNFLQFSKSRLNRDCILYFYLVNMSRNSKKQQKYSKLTCSKFLKKNFWNVSRWYEIPQWNVEAILFVAKFNKFIKNNKPLLVEKILRIWPSHCIHTIWYTLSYIHFQHLAYFLNECIVGVITDTAFKYLEHNIVLHFVNYLKFFCQRERETEICIFKNIL